MYIISIFSLAVICFYAYFLYNKYIKESQITENIYLKIKEKFDNDQFLKIISDTKWTFLKPGTFKIWYADKCISEEEKIKNILLNLDSDYEILNSIFVDYYKNIIHVNINLFWIGDIRISPAIYCYRFEYNIHKQENITVFLNKIEKIITIIRNSVLDIKKLDNLSEIEKVNLIKDNINRLSGCESNPIFVKGILKL